MESLLHSERSKAKDLASKLYQTQAELNMIKTQGSYTPLAPTRLNFETISPAHNHSTTPSTLSRPTVLHK